ncbi:hypothetical protein WH47_07589 [Habropoda laboriosa]|uniref:Uncharacterized protein n=1 Tax=Habropoda laboriosa TaxID=597456 RepID=A0A0L7RE68_9HYME|nr:hypothetical protein WH47_07589 [Habropoda laboriosa]
MFVSSSKTSIAAHCKVQRNPRNDYYYSSFISKTAHSYLSEIYKILRVKERKN